MPKKTVSGTYEGVEISVVNTWLGGITLYIGGEQKAQNRQLFSVSGGIPIMECSYAFPSGVKNVKVHCQAIATTKIQIHVDGKFLAGELF